MVDDGIRVRTLALSSSQIGVSVLRRYRLGLRVSVRSLCHLWCLALPKHA